MIDVFDSILDAEGFGGILLRYAIILTPAIIALVLLTDWYN
jgi:hypothetical protein